MAQVKTASRTRGSTNGRGRGKDNGKAVRISKEKAKNFELSNPVLIKAGRTPIDVEVGHAAPFVADLDGDGKPDLLVGQFGQGKLRIYRNTGTARNPRLNPDFKWMRAGRVVGKVPSG